MGFLCGFLENEIQGDSYRDREMGIQRNGQCVIETAWNDNSGKKDERKAPTSLIFLRLPTAFQTRFLPFLWGREGRILRILGKELPIYIWHFITTSLIFFILFLFYFFFKRKGMGKKLIFIIILRTERDLSYKNARINFCIFKWYLTINVFVLSLHLNLLIVTYLRFKKTKLMELFTRNSRCVCTHCLYMGVYAGRSYFDRGN